MKSLLVLLLFCMMASVFAAENAGKTIVTRGQVDAVDAAVTRALKRASPVFSRDMVLTGKESNTQLRMADGSILSLQAQTQLNIVDYQFNQTSQTGSASLALLKGGLRTITGTLKAKTEQYKMVTPVASIGVRGTHYEAELVDGDLYLAVWSGAIDVQVTLGLDPLKFSLGEGQDHVFAIVRKNGDVEFSLLVPDAFTVGHSEQWQLSSVEYNQPFSDIEKNIQLQPLRTKQVKNGTTVIDSVENSLAGEFDRLGDGLLDTDDFWATLAPVMSQVLTEKSGLVIFDQVLNHSLASNVGDVSNVAMSITIDFNTARAPTGQLSFTDDIGEWFAVFNGVFVDNALEVNINFATHGNALADGQINGIFIDNGEQILGGLSLNEIDNIDNEVNGGFLLGIHSDHSSP